MTFNRLLVVVMVALGCLVGGVASTLGRVSQRGSMTVGNRSVSLYSDGFSSSLTNLGGSVEIKTAGKLITVGDTVLMIDEEQVGTLPEGTRKVTVTMDKGDITFEADGAPVETTYEPE